MSDKKTLHWLDLMRGLAAIAVMSGHIRSLTLLDYNPHETGVIGKAFYFLTGFGHQAVIIFFVLSGFLITMSIDRSVKNNRWSLASYSIDRLTRLWIVLIPALLLTAFFDKLGMALFPESIAYLGKINTLPGINPAGKSDIVTFAGNIFFFQGILVEVFGTNSPLWSLSYEFWYYCIFPLIFFSIYKNDDPPLRAGFLVLTLVLLWFIGLEASLYFITWLMGAGAYYYAQRRDKTKKYLVVTGLSLLMFAFSLVCTRANLFPKFIGDISIGFTTALLVSFLCDQPLKSSFWEKTASSLSRISYTVYLLHMPLAIFLSSWLVSERNIWGFYGAGIYVLILLFVLSLCYVIWTIFEKNTQQVKQIIKSKLVHANKIG